MASTSPQWMVVPKRRGKRSSTGEAAGLRHRGIRIAQHEF